MPRATIAWSVFVRTKINLTYYGGSSTDAATEEFLNTVHLQCHLYTIISKYIGWGNMCSLVRGVARTTSLTIGGWAVYTALGVSTVP